MSKTNAKKIVSNKTENRTTNLIHKEETHYQQATSFKEWLDNWDFTKSETKTYTHRIHNYPAIFIPQLVRKVLEEYSSEGDLVLDIFNGSGTTSVECSLTNRNSIGIELNPLAILISKTKTDLINPALIENELGKIKERYEEKGYKYPVANFKNIDFWYSGEAIKNISKLLSAIREIQNEKIRNFMLVSISKILREVSVCKHSGFKMHKDPKKEALVISSDYLWNKFSQAFDYNLGAYQSYYAFFEGRKQPSTKMIQGSSTDKQTEIKANSIDLIVTSPPYGDSKTTVAYGQFSRLSSQWLELGGSQYTTDSIANLDSDLLGGRTTDIQAGHGIIEKSVTLKSVNELFECRMALEKDATKQKKLEKRLKDVLSFYVDLDKTIANGSFYLKPEKYFILVTASRIVKDVKLHTDMIIAELGEHYGLELKGIMYRNIPNKRMPRQVSATNVTGEKANTMTRESIIILKKIN